MKRYTAATAAILVPAGRGSDVISVVGEAMSESHRAGRAENRIPFFPAKRWGAVAI